jgi:hypothetical protein
LVIRIDNGRGPSTSGRDRSVPTAVSQATRSFLALARKNRHGKLRCPPRSQSHKMIASIAATVMPCPQMALKL